MCLYLSLSMLPCAMSCRGGAANSYRHPTKLHNKSASHRSPSESQPWTPQIIVLARRVVKDHVHRGVVGSSRRNWPRLCSGPHSQQPVLHESGGGSGGPGWTGHLKTGCAECSPLLPRELANWWHHTEVGIGKLHVEGAGVFLGQPV
jgi:hypothetical protein